VIIYDGFQNQPLLNHGKSRFQAFDFYLFTRSDLMIICLTQSVERHVKASFRLLEAMPLDMRQVFDLPKLRKIS